MYIRRTHTNNSATGERYFTYRLVKSERVGDSTRQSTLLNLGRHFAIKQDYWPTLCARVDEIMGCQLALLPIECPLVVEREPQRIAALLLVRRGVSLPAPEPASKTARPAAVTTSVTTAPSAPAAPASDIQSVDVASLERHRPRSVGVEQLGLWAMQQFGFIELLTSLDTTVTLYDLTNTYFEGEVPNNSKAQSPRHRPALSH